LEGVGRTGLVGPHGAPMPATGKKGGEVGKRRREGCSFLFPFLFLFLFLFLSFLLCLMFFSPSILAVFEDVCSYLTFTSVRDNRGI